MKPTISITDVHKKFGSVNAIEDVSFDVPRGQVTAIIGPSGSGKTTLLRCLNNLVAFDKGKVEIDDFTITSRSSTPDARVLREKVGIVFQQFNLWPHKTVLENIIEAPRIVCKLSKPEAIKKAEKLLDKVGLLDKTNEHPQNLSGGQQQRVAIARALAMEPNVLLFDEITSALDPELSEEVLGIVKNIVAEHRRTIIIVTHEMGFARDIADEVIFMDKGKIIEKGSPEQIFQNPRNERTKKFLQNVFLYKL